MISILDGLSQGDFTHLRVLHNGQMTDILTLLGGSGSGTGRDGGSGNLAMR